MRANQGLASKSFLIGPSKFRTSKYKTPLSFEMRGSFISWHAPLGVGWLGGPDAVGCACRRGIINQINSVDAREFSYYDTGSGWGKSNCPGLLREGG